MLVGAMRSDAPRHAVMRAALEALRASPEPLALCDPVLSGALAIEQGCEVLSDDADYARLPGVRWQRP